MKVESCVHASSLDTSRDGTNPPSPPLSNLDVDSFTTRCNLSEDAPHYLKRRRGSGNEGKGRKRGRWGGRERTEKGSENARGGSDAPGQTSICQMGRYATAPEQH